MLMRVLIVISIPLLPAWMTLSLVIAVIVFEGCYVRKAKFNKCVFKIMKTVYLGCFAATNIGMLMIYYISHLLSPVVVATLGYLCMASIITNILLEFGELIYEVVCRLRSLLS